VNFNSDKQWYVAIGDIRFGFHWSVGDSLMMGFPPPSQHGSYREGSE
jgi:hypothetical protein